MEKGVADPIAFYHPGEGMRCVVHGDEFTFLGWESDLEEMAKRLREHYQLKVRGILGGEPGDVEEITILNRKLTWRANEMKYEADPKHAEIIERGVGLDAGTRRPTCRGIMGHRAALGATVAWREDHGGTLGADSRLAARCQFAT